MNSKGGNAASVPTTTFLVALILSNVSPATAGIALSTAIMANAAMPALNDWFVILVMSPIY